ncbi:MAG: polysaccharide deacetylase family protein [Clostridia bacterium]|nr:polysaccharide deacetylase family protein [Clostridia bacterium]
MLIAIALLFIGVNAFLTQRYVSQVTGHFREDIPIYSVDSDGKKCAITFDCAWGADDIPNILDSLDKFQAKATFFIVGLWAEKYPETVKLIASRGHEIANHGYSHQHMAQIPEAKIEEEITRCTEVLEKLSGARITLFRPPYGEYNSTTVKVSRRMNYEIIQWDVDSLDWKQNLSSENIYQRVIKGVNTGSIILFHNDTLHTQEVLPRILENLTKNGYSCITVSDLLLKDHYKIRYDGRQMRE